MILLNYNYSLNLQEHVFSCHMGAVETICKPLHWTNHLLSQYGEDVSKQLHIYIMSNVGIQ